MSHIVTIQTRVHDPAAVAAACRRLGLDQPVQGTAQLYSGEATGLLVQLPAAFTQLVAGKQQRTFLVVLAPVVQVPVELEKLFVVLEHPLPDREQLERIARELTADHPEELPQGDDLARVLDAAAGLTRYEAEGAFALSLTRHNALWPESIWELKAQALKKNNLLALHRGGERFDELGGLAGLKEFRRRALAPRRADAAVKLRGLLLLSPPGCGKSAFCKALGAEVGRPTLLLDLGALYGSLVGATEANVRQALRVADAMAPCVLFVDELEKALSGVGGSGDGGGATRLFGTVLTWLSDHTSDVFFVGTANDVSRLPPPFAPPTYLMQVAPEVYAEERRRVAARFDEAVRLAEQAFAAEFARLLSHLAERLSGGEAGERRVFRDSAVTNLTEFFERFGQLNVRSNPELDALVEQAQALVRGVTPQGLRTDEGLRRHVAAEMAVVRQRVEGLIVDAPGGAWSAAAAR